MLFEYIVCQREDSSATAFPGCCFIVQEVEDGLSAGFNMRDRKACDRKSRSADSVPGWNSYFK